jgi:two-component system, cell cycle sensor histidine kinase and response regulator CckA
MDRVLRRTRTAWPALALVALVVVEAGNLALVRDAATRAAASNALQSLAAALAAGAVFAAIRRLRRERSDAAPGWTLIGVGACLFLAGAITFWVGELLSVAPPYPDASDAFFLASYPAMMVGLARLPRERLSRAERWNAVLDLAILLLVTGVAVWEVSLRDLLTALVAKRDAASAVSLAYTLLNLALLAVLYARLVLNLGQGRMFVPNLLLVVAGLVLTASDLAMGRVASTAVFTSGSPIDLGWLLFAALGGFAGLYVLERGDDAGIVQGTALRASWTTALVYACLAGGGAVLIWALYHKETADLHLLTVAAAGTLALAGTRQLRSVRQADRLAAGLEEARADLETKVRERTAELEAAGTSLRASEEKYRGLFELESDALVLVDNATGRILEANAAAAALYGFSRDELLARTNAALSAEPEETKRATGQTPPAPDSAVTIPLRWHRKRDGTVFPVEITARFFTWSGRPVHVAAIRDSTERKRAADALGESEARFRLIAAQLDDVLFVTDDATIITYISPAAERLFGYPPGAMEGHGFTTFLAETETPEALELFRRAMAGGGTAHRFEMAMRRRDGSVFTGELRGTVFREAGRLGAIGSIRDITDRKRAEAALQESEVRFKAQYRHLPTPTFTWRADGEDFRLVDCNDAARAVAGGPLGELVGQRASELYADRREMLTDLRRCRAQNEVLTRETQSEHFLPGRVVVITLVSVPPDMVMVHLEDVTDRRRAAEENAALQAQLLQSQKLESVGRLAGGVAHDFNNAVQTILLNTEMAAAHAPEGTALRRYLTDIRTSAQHSAGLTAQLLTFARKQTARPRVVDLNTVVPAMLPLLQRLIGEDVATVWTPGSALWRVRIDPMQVDQILTNLAVNARDAIVGVGRLQIATINATVDEAFAAAHPDLTPGDYVRLTVADNGSGMDAETMAHIFEPFYTTKPVGAGTGLGLATVYGIVSQNAGAITVDSAPGMGSAFAVWLPRAEAADTAAPPAHDVAAAPRGGTETILLVEDEAALLRAAGAILRGLGYTVLAAERPVAALSTAAAHDGPIHLLVTDVVMPEMNGRLLADRLCDARPTLKRLYVSGYTGETIGQRGVLETDAPFLPKPFSAEALAQKVREVLDGAPGP